MTTYEALLERYTKNIQNLIYPFKIPKFLRKYLRIIKNKRLHFKCLIWPVMVVMKIRSLESIIACFRYRQSRFNARRIRKRVVFKHGDCNVGVANVAKRRRKYLQDIFTTLVDAQWRWTLLVFAMNFLLSWLGFAVVWWLIVFSHGDLSPERLVSLTINCLFISLFNSACKCTYFTSSVTFCLVHFF